MGKKSTISIEAMKEALHRRGISRQAPEGPGEARARADLLERLRSRDRVVEPREPIVEAVAAEREGR